MLDSTYINKFNEIMQMDACNFLVAEAYLNITLKECENMASGAVTEGMLFVIQRFFEDFRYILALQTNF